MVKGHISEYIFLNVWLNKVTQHIYFSFKNGNTEFLQNAIFWSHNDVY